MTKKEKNVAMEGRKDKREGGRKKWKEGRKNGKEGRKEWGGREEGRKALKAVCLHAVVLVTVKRSTRLLACCVSEAFERERDSYNMMNRKFLLIELF